MATNEQAASPPPVALDHVLKAYSRLTMILMVPVSITIFVVVWSVQNLTPLYAQRDQSPLYLAADESSAGTPQKKLEASTINALVVVGMVLGITLIMVLLYKLRCMKVIITWFVVSAALIFFMLAWVWTDLICTKYQIPYDYLGMAVFLWNFGVVGIVAIFYYAPAKMMQGYLVFLSIIIAWMMTRLPEWTTWGVLLAIAIYDICAVLMPKGPLQMLVRLAQERNEPIPGFVYDSADTAGLAAERRHSPPATPRRESQTPSAGTRSAPSEGAGSEMTAVGAGAAATAAEQQQGSRRATTTPPAAPPTPMPPQPNYGSTSSESGVAQPPSDAAAAGRSQRQSPTGSDRQNVPSQQQLQQQQQRQQPEEEEDEEEPDPFESADIAMPFKLGLGDFIFYSILVGRAAQYSYVSWMTCYICVINGLVGTLTCLLFLRGKVPALPALPFSIFAGAAAFFVTRYTTVPYTTYISLSGLMV